MKDFPYNKLPQLDYIRIDEGTVDGYTGEYFSMGFDNDPKKQVIFLIIRPVTVACSAEIIELCHELHKDFPFKSIKNKLCFRQIKTE